MAKRLTVYPPHPAIDWGAAYHIGGIECVNTTCTVCGKTWRERAASVAYRIRNGTFRGRCPKDRLLGSKRKGETYPTLDGVNYSVSRPHAVKGQPRQTQVRVACPLCKEVRWKTPSYIRWAYDHEVWSARCRRCRGPKNHLDGRFLGKHGYVTIFRCAVSDELRPMFDKIKRRRRGGHILEHRLVMAQSIGRVLRVNEVVHHRNGQRNDNRIENLQLFRKGKHHPGHGDHYHEIEHLLAEIAHLKAEAVELRSRLGE